MDKSSLAREILECNELWERIGKEVIADNVEKRLIEIYPECTTYKAKVEHLMKVSGSQKDAVCAWVNRSRSNVKIPFLKLCKISDALGIDIYDILKNDNE